MHTNANFVQKGPDHNPIAWFRSQQLAEGLPAFCTNNSLGMPEEMAITAQELDELYRSLQERQAKEGVVFVHGAGKQKPTLQKVMKPGEDWRLPKRAKNKKGGCPSSALFSAVLRHPLFPILLWHHYLIGRLRNVLVAQISKLCTNISLKRSKTALYSSVFQRTTSFFEHFTPDFSSNVASAAAQLRFLNS